MKLVGRLPAWDSLTLWWRHQMETFSALLALCAGNSPVIPPTKASDAELWCFLWSVLNKRLSKQSRRRWFDTPSRSLWRHRNEVGGQAPCMGTADSKVWEPKNRGRNPISGQNRVIKSTFPLNIWNGGSKSYIFLQHREKGGLNYMFSQCLEKRVGWKPRSVLANPTNFIVGEPRMMPMT